MAARPPVGRDVRRSRRLTGFRPAGRPPLPAAAKEAKRRRGWAPMGVPAHSRATPGPPFTGVIPIPFRRSSGAQNTVPGVDSFRATGPWSGAKFWPAPFYNRAWFRPAVAEGAGRGRAGRSRSHESGTGGSQTRPYGDVSLPRRSFGFFPIAGKETRPAGRNPVRRRAESSRPTGVTVHGRRAGQETRPYGEPLAFPRHGGRGKPLPYGWKGKHSATEDRRAATWGRPYDGISGRTQQNGAAHLKNPQKPLQLFPVLYSNISQKPGYVTIMTQYYGFVTLRPNPLTGGLH